MLSKPIPDFHHLTDAERSEYLTLARRKNELQPLLGTVNNDLEEVQRVVHRLRELDTIALSRAELSTLGERAGGPADARAPASEPSVL